MCAMNFAHTGQGLKPASGSQKVSFSPAISQSGSTSSSRGSWPHHPRNDELHTYEALPHPNYLSQPIPPRSVVPDSPAHSTLPPTQSQPVRTQSGSDDIAKVLESANWDTPASVQLVVVNDFEPCCSTELKAYKGQSVVGLFQNGAWIYVRALTGEEGYLPNQFCAMKPSLYRPPSSSGVSSCFGEDDQSLTSPPVGHGSNDDRQMHRRSSDQTDSGHVSSAGAGHIIGYHSEPDKVNGRVSFAVPKTRNPWQIGHSHVTRPQLAVEAPRQVSVSGVSGREIHQWRRLSQTSPGNSPTCKEMESISPGSRRKNFTFPVTNEQQRTCRSSDHNKSTTTRSNKKRLIDRIKHFRNGDANLEVFSFDHSSRSSSHGSCSGGQSPCNGSVASHKVAASDKECKRESKKEKKRKQAKKVKSHLKENATASDTEVTAAAHSKHWRDAYHADPHDRHTDSETVRHHIHNLRLTSASSDTEEHTRRHSRPSKTLHLHSNGNNHPNSFSPGEFPPSHTENLDAVTQSSISHPSTSDNIVTSFVLYDFISQQAGQLSVTRGQQVHKFYNTETDGRATEAGWIFVMDPETSKKGFIPQACLQPLPSSLAAPTVPMFSRMAHDV